MKLFRIAGPVVLALSMMASAALAEPASSMAVSSPVTPKSDYRAGMGTPPPHSTPVQASCWTKTFTKLITMSGDTDDDWKMAHHTACAICKLSC